MGLFNFKRKPDVETILTNKVQQAVSSLDKVYHTTTDHFAKIAISNAKMMLESIGDRFVNYTEETVNQIFNFINAVLSEVKTAAIGNTDFEGTTIKSVSFKDSIARYVSLISHFIQAYVLNGDSTIDFSKAEGLFDAVRQEMNNEALKIIIEQDEKKLEEVEAKIKKIEDEMKKLLDLPDTPANHRRWTDLKDDKETLEGDHASIYSSIQETKAQIKENKKFTNELAEYKKSEKIYRYRAYTSPEEYMKIQQQNIERKLEDEARREAINTAYGETHKKAVTEDDGYAEAKRKRELEKAEFANKAKDDENFSVPANNKNVDNF